MKEDISSAINVALALNHPGKIYKIFCDLVPSKFEKFYSSNCCIAGCSEINQVLHSITLPQKFQLLCHIQTWITKTNTTAVGQILLYAVLKQLRVKEIYSLAEQISNGELSFVNVGYVCIIDTLYSLISYSEQYLRNIDRLSEESYMTELILVEMDESISDGAN